MSGRACPSLRPTKHAAGLLFVLATMWYAGASQNNGAAYLLLFALSAVALVSLPHTLLNLTDIRLTAGSVKPVFAGQEGSLPVEISNGSQRARHACTLTLPETGVAPELVPEIAPGKSARVTLQFSAVARGEYEIRELRLASSYPLGFFRARKWVATRQRYLVYPKPTGELPLPSGQRRSQGSFENLPGEGEEFAGVRAYVPGESQRHIDWKAVARGQPMMTKQFAAETDQVLQLDFATIPFPAAEQRLSQLALWIVEAEQGRHLYGLRLPNLKISPSSGEVHYHRCLQALARYHWNGGE
ncbi:MAG: DUF58 domain-containing protein [Chthoniobacterales bacterium]